MPDNILGGQGATLLTAVVIVSVALLALVGVFWLLRARSASTFIRGGKHRQPRLAVLDAAAVDTRRRLVLIRRDDVEHLVMIGGPTDIVIESGITGPGQAQPAPPPREPQERPAPPPRPAPPQRPAHPAPTPSAPPARPSRAEPVAAPEPVRAPPAAPTPAASAPSASAPPAPRPQATAPVAAATAAAAGPIGSIRAEAADVLETVRTRVFEEPSFDGAAFDELTGDGGSPQETRPAPPPPTPPAASSTPAPAAPSPAPGASAPAAAPATGDFESVLAAELSGDLSLDGPGEDFLEASDEEEMFLSEAPDRADAPEVRPEPQSSRDRDTLEAEMERLLGDLARKP